MARPSPPPPPPSSSSPFAHAARSSPTFLLWQDVSYFLQWAAEPEQDERKLMGFKWITALCICAAFTWYYKRVKWAPIKTRRIVID